MALVVRKSGAIYLIERGSIIRATVPDERGVNPKTRPVLILSRTADIEANPAEIVVACITTTPDDDRASKYVFVSTSGQACTTTGLSARSWVNTRWLWIIAREQIERLDGPIEPADLAAVIQRVQTAGGTIPRAPAPSRRPRPQQRPPQ